MTPKEKAKELVDRFIGYSYFSDGNHSMNRQCQQESNAIQCALIAVDEILKIHSVIISYHTEIYWQEVKQEILKLE